MLIVKRFSMLPYIEQKLFGARKRKENARLMREQKNAEMHANRAAKKAAKIEEMANKLTAKETLTAAEKDMLKNGGYMQSVKDVARGGDVAATSQVAKQATAATQASGRAGETVAKMAKGTRKSLANGGQLNINGGEFVVKHGKGGKRSGGLKVTLKDHMTTTQAIENKPGKKVAYIEGTKKSGKATNKIQAVLNDNTAAKVEKAAGGPKIVDSTNKTLVPKKTKQSVVIETSTPKTQVITETTNKVNKVVAPEVTGGTPKVATKTLNNGAQKFATKTLNNGTQNFAKKMGSLLKKNGKTAGLVAGGLALGAAAGYGAKKLNDKKSAQKA